MAPLSNMKTVLITGGAGFLGSHITDRFIKENWNVIVLDNLLTGSIDNIAHLIGEENFKFVKYNVTNYLFFKEDIDLILHFACPASPFDYNQYPIHTMKVDSIGTLNTLGLAKKKKSRYIFASTAEIYGNPAVHPQSEDYWGNVNPIGLRSVYHEAKRFSEAMSMAYYREHNINIQIARIFNTYGARMRLNDGRVVPTFISQAIKNEDITIFGDGSHTRSFCYIEDLVNSIYRLSTETDLAGEVFNIGNPEEKTIKELAELIIRETGSNSKIVFRDIPQDDPLRRKPDITKAQNLLDFYPKIDLLEGIRKVIPWFKESIHG